MSWRYENYGTADLLTSSAETVETSHSKFGYAYKTYGYTFVYFGIPTTATEIWVKCDVYFTNDYSDGDRFGIAHRLNADCEDCGFWNGNSISRNGIYCINSKFNTHDISDSAFKKNSFHTFWFHMKSDSSNGLIDLYIDGKFDDNLISGRDLNHGNPFDNFFMNSYPSMLVSNIIISDEEIGLYENVSLDRLGLREYSLPFSREKILAGYNLNEISSSLFRYNDAVKSLADLLLDRLKIYETSKQSTIQKFSSITSKLQTKYIPSSHLTDEENKLLADRQKVLSQELQLDMSDVKNKIINVKVQIERLEQRIDEINCGENSLTELAALNRNCPDFSFVADNLLNLIAKWKDTLKFFDDNEWYVSNIADAQLAWTDSYKSFKTSLREELAADCRNDGIDEEIFSAWYDDWQKKRFAIEERYLPLTEFLLKGHVNIFNTFWILDCYKDSVDKFYLHERKNIYQKFAFTAGGDLQEKFETESELYKLAEKFQRDLQEIIFSRGKTEERIFLLRWSEPLLNISIDEISNFIRDKELDAISEEVLTQFAELRRQNFAAYIADSQAYSDAVQKREKEFNALIFRMRKDLHKK